MKKIVILDGKTLGDISLEKLNEFVNYAINIITSTLNIIIVSIIILIP